MSVWAARERHEQFQRERDLIAMRGTVVAAVVAHAPVVGSSAIEEAVGEGLAQLVAAGEHLGEAAQVRERWILYAKRRVIDELRSAESKHRDPIAVDEHVHALALSASGDPAGSTEESRTAWRIRELLSQLRGEQRRWAEAWYDQILAGSLPPGSQPRGLAEAFGWSAPKTKSVSHRARMKMAAFTEQRARGEICAERRAVLDDFILTTASRDTEVPADRDQARYEQVVFHIAGCEDCWTAWQNRRRSLRGRCIAVLTLPFGWFADIAQAARAKLAGLIGSAHSTGYSLRQRLGLGGGASAAAGGGAAASLGGKAAVICIGAVCAATAGGGALITAVPSILPQSLRHSSPPVTHPKGTATAASKAVHLASYTATTPGVPVTATSTEHSPVTSKPTFHPGNLPPASSETSTTPSEPSATTATTASLTQPLPTHQTTAETPSSSAPTGHPKCVLGDLGC